MNWQIANPARAARAVGVVACGFFAAHTALAQTCTPVSLARIGSLAGERISSIEITTSAPEKMPGAASVLDAIHIRTGHETIRRQLLVSPGEPLDTLRALESIHRLLRQPYLSDAWLELQECSDSAGTATVHLRVVTKDSWSTRPTIKVRSSATATIGLEERNVLGTGRSIKAYVRSDAGRTGVGVAYSDPWLFNSPLSGTLSRNVYRDGQDWRISLGTRPRSVFDKWNSELSLSQSQRISLAAPDSLRRASANLMVSRLWRSSATGATSILLGLEGEKTRLSVSADAAIVGPASVNRVFAGFDAGLARHSALYGSVDWYLPGGAAADLPLGFEGEGVVGMGRDFVSRTGAVHVDLWGGRIWMPRRDLFITGGGWLYGFVQGGRWQAGTSRVAFSLFKQAQRGIWAAHFGAEQLTDPDPDVRALGTLDPTVRALRQRSRMAESAVAASLERSVHLFGLTRGYAVDGALFGALSSRWEPAAPNTDRVSLAVVGGGFRINPTHLGRASVRVDIGYPIAASPGLSRRVFLGLTLSPWIEAGRSRLGAEPR